MGYLTVAKDLE